MHRGVDWLCRNQTSDRRRSSRSCGNTLRSEAYRRVLEAAFPQGSTFAAVNKADLCKDLETFRLCHPSTEQREIAAILSSVDDAIEKTQAVIDQVQVVKRGLMQELLTTGPAGAAHAVQADGDWQDSYCEDGFCNSRG